jgi:23S rRNA (pseudouridine1915-N3)-methyltransferase
MPRGYEISRVPLRDADLKTVPSKYRGSRIVALDERGKELTTVQFSKLLGEETAFVIGGADGLPEKFKKNASQLVRLSAMTLPHALAQIVLIEQIYRAATLLTGHPYHRS